MNETSIAEFGSTIFESGFLNFLISSAVSWAFAVFLVKLMYRGMKKTEKIRGKAATTSLSFGVNVMRVVIYTIAAFITLSMIKPLAFIGKAALGATSIIAVISGLAAQETFGNFVAGAVIAIVQPFQIGDVVSIPSQSITGTVAEVTMRHVVLLTYDNTRVLIPNSTMNSAVVEDKRNGSEVITPLITVSVAYGTDIDLACRLINEIALKEPDFIDQRTEKDHEDGVPAVKVAVTEFQDSGIELSFRVAAMDSGKAYWLASNIRKEILKKFDENQIVIPYPTRTILKG